MIVEILSPPPPPHQIRRHRTFDRGRRLPIKRSELFDTPTGLLSSTHTLTHTHTHQSSPSFANFLLFSILCLLSSHPSVLSSFILYHPPCPPPAAPQTRSSLRSFGSQSCGSKSNRWAYTAQASYNQLDSVPGRSSLPQHLRPSRLLLFVGKASIPLSETSHCTNRQPVRQFHPAARSNHPSGRLHDNPRGLHPLFPLLRLISIVPVAAVDD